MLIGAWWELLAPCIALTMLAMQALFPLNFAVDEIANPQLRSHKGMKRWKKLQPAINKNANQNYHHKMHFGAEHKQSCLNH